MVRRSSGPRRARARKFSPSRGPSTIQASSKCPWERPSANWSSTSAAASRRTRNSRPPSSGVLREAASPRTPERSYRLRIGGRVGAIVGSGGLIVTDEDTCMVDFARFFVDFIQDESCGKCPPCRIGTKRMLEILTRITHGQGKEKGHRQAHRARRAYQGRGPVRSRPDRAEPGALDPALLQARILGAHQGQVLSGGRVQLPL